MINARNGVVQPHEIVNIQAVESFSICIEFFAGNLSFSRFRFII